MSKGVTMSDGSQLYLFDFGIDTLGYFNAPDNERNAYHILTMSKIPDVSDCVVTVIPEATSLAVIVNPLTSNTLVADV